MDFRTSVRTLAGTFLLVAAGSFGAIPGPGPGFDCGKARSSVEKRICSDPALAALDRQLNQIYKQTLASLNNESDRVALKASQRDWLTLTRNACVDSRCLIRAYHERHEEIRLGVAEPIPDELDSLIEREGNADPRIWDQEHWPDAVHYGTLVARKRRLLLGYPGLFKSVSAQADAANVLGDARRAAEQRAESPIERQAIVSVDLYSSTDADPRSVSDQVVETPAGSAKADGYHDGPVFQAGAGQAESLPTAAATSAPRFVEQERQAKRPQLTEDQQRMALKIGSVVLLINLIVAVFMHRSGSLTIYGDYTDALFTALTPFLLLAFAAILFYLEVPEVLIVSIVMAGLAVSLIFVFVASAKENSGVATTLMAFIAKITLVSMFLVYIALLFGQGSSQRQGESRAAFERRRSAEAKRRGGLAIIATTLMALMSTYVCRRQGFRPLGHYMTFQP